MGEQSMRATGWARAFPISGGIRAGRAWTRDHLDTIGWTTRVPETADDVLLTVSELITNAHFHAHSNAILVLTWDNHCLHVSVHDSSPVLPVPRAPDATATGGRGIGIVDALSDGWHARPQTDGKTVTACFRPSGTSDPHTDRGHGGRPLGGR
ncbi:ATP-binding protein [Kitasatospora sp. NPDC002040]|uniref:ATP-binding protein n=1 Tax=Kitasatospora sp. NPDC002040 TaxID=3154661 RepID=UPI00332FFA56